MTSEERMVIFASSLGTVFEWYDFYIYGTLAPILAAQFFSGVNPTAAFIFTLLAFAAGFAVRPFGALFFGRLGDLVGRKYTFIITMTLMGVGTFFIGLLPSYASVGIIAPIILIGLRLAQGLALGGEYGGAAIYVCEHAPRNKRGFYTSWIQTTATLGLFMALLLVLGIRTSVGEPAFVGKPEVFWAAWRIPFLFSAVLLAVSIAIRRVLRTPGAVQYCSRFGAFVAPYHDPAGNPTLQFVATSNSPCSRRPRLRRGVVRRAPQRRVRDERVTGGDDRRGRRAYPAHHARAPGVNSLTYHHPFILADRIVQLDHLTAGRVMLGMGPAEQMDTA